MYFNQFQPILRLIINEYSNIDDQFQEFDCLEIVQFMCLKFNSNQEFLKDYEFNLDCHFKIADRISSNIDIVSDLGINIISSVTANSDDLFEV